MGFKILVIVISCCFVSIVSQQQQLQPQQQSQQPEQQQQQPQQQQTCNAPVVSYKNGSCPAPLPNMNCFWCADSCTFDQNCPGTQKCCPQPGCGNSCKDVSSTPPPTCNAQITSSKPGSCPTPMQLNCFWCFDGCKADHDCSGTKKCCPQPGCGNTCEDIVPPTTCGAIITHTKPATCPVPININCGWCQDSCKADNDCGGTSICCFQPGCGNSCVQIVQFNSTANCGGAITSNQPGTCPPPVANAVCSGCFDTCRSDNDCFGQWKCCPQPGCGNWCRTPQ